MVMTMKHTLQELQARVAALDKGSARASSDALQKIVPYELWPLIEESPILKTEYERRLQYLPNLAHDADYVKLIDDIHAFMREIYRAVDPEKLPEERLVRPKFTDPDHQTDWISLQDFHAILRQPDEWWKLGEARAHRSNDSLLCPFQIIIGQYETVLGFLRQARKGEAIDVDRCVHFTEKLQERVTLLRDKLEKPFHRMHILAFEWFDWYMQNPQYITGDRMENVQQNVDRVCKDLLLALENPTQETPPKAVESKGVRIPPLVGEELEKRKLLDEYDRLLKSVDLKAFRQKYKENPAVLETLQRVTSPEFLRMVGEGIEHRRKTEERYAKIAEEAVKKTIENIPALLKVHKQMEEQTKKASAELERMFTAYRPSLQKLAEFSAATASALSRDLEGLHLAVEKLDVPARLAITSMAKHFDMLKPSYQSLPMGIGAIVELPGSQYMSDFLSHGPVQAVALPPPSPRLNRGEVIVSEHYLMELLEAVRDRRGDNAKPELVVPKKQVTTVWTGDKPVLYDGERLKIGSESPAKIPGEDDAENRRVLLSLLVAQYQEDEEDSMGITEAFFQRKLKDIGLSSGSRSLESAKSGINKEVRQAFGLRRFVRMRGQTAYIFKRYKGE